MIELWLAAAVLLFVPWRWLPLGLLVVILLGLPGLKARWGGAPYVWSSKKTVNTMVRLAAIQRGETVYDLGCGDGRLVRRAAHLGAHATGLEASFLTFLLAWCWSVPVRNARIRFGDLWKGDYRSADVIFCYLLVANMERFEREIWPTLKTGCRVVSNSFRMKGIEPTAVEGGVYLYVQRSASASTSALAEGASVLRG